MIGNVVGDRKKRVHAYVLHKHTSVDAYMHGCVVADSKRE